MTEQAMVVRGSRTGLARSITLVAYVTLILAESADNLLRGAPTGIWVLGLLPLLVFLPGMLRDSVRTYIWLCFVILGYFVILVERLFKMPTDPVSWVAMVSVLVLFNAAMLYSRWRSQELRGEDESPQS